MKFAIKLWVAGDPYRATPVKLHEMKALGSTISFMAEALQNAGPNAANMEMTVGPFQIQITVEQSSAFAITHWPGEPSAEPR